MSRHTLHIKAQDAITQSLKVIEQANSLSSEAQLEQRAQSVSVVLSSARPLVACTLHGNVDERQEQVQGIYKKEGGGRAAAMDAAACFKTCAHRHTLDFSSPASHSPLSMGTKLLFMLTKLSYWHALAARASHAAHP